MLLNVDYYHQDLKPVLARWALLWLAKEGLVVDPTTEPQLLAYLQGSRTAPNQVESGRDFQLLNLCSDWLCCFMPHCLQKIDRCVWGFITSHSLCG